MKKNLKIVYCMSKDVMMEVEFSRRESDMIPVFVPQIGAIVKVKGLKYKIKEVEHDVDDMEITVKSDIWLDYCRKKKQTRLDAELEALKTYPRGRFGTNRPDLGP